VILNDIDYIDVDQLPSEVRGSSAKARRVEIEQDADVPIPEGFSLEEEVADLEKYYISKARNSTDV